MQKRWVSKTSLESKEWEDEKGEEKKNYLPAVEPRICTLEGVGKI
jgi:hypothetical protein